MKRSQTAEPHGRVALIHGALEPPIMAPVTSFEPLPHVEVVARERSARGPRSASRASPFSARVVMFAVGAVVLFVAIATLVAFVGG